MTAYVLAQMSIHDRPVYDAYASRFFPTLAPYDGRLLAADERPEVIEGSWPLEKVVLIAFPDAERAKAWMASDAYRAISRDREAATTETVLLVAGFG